MMMVFWLLLIASYVLGSFPTGNVLARLLKGVDLRTYGSRTVGTSNAGQLLGKKAVVIVGVLDALKGAVPVWTAQALGLGPGSQIACGAAAVVGHNWSIFLGFRGGRGVATMLGAVFAASPIQILPYTVVSVVGWLVFKNVPLFMGVATFLLPVWAFMLREDPAYVLGMLSMAIIVFAKRLMANDLPTESRSSVLLYRFLYDRDVKDRNQWVRRGQQNSKKPAA